MDRGQTIREIWSKKTAFQFTERERGCLVLTSVLFHVFPNLPPIFMRLSMWTAQQKVMRQDKWWGRLFQSVAPLYLKPLEKMCFWPWKWERIKDMYECSLCYFPWALQGSLSDGRGGGVRLFRIVNNSRNSWIVMLRKILACACTEPGMQGGSE